MARSSRGAKVLFVIAGVLLALTGLLGFLNSQVGDSQNFAEHVNDIRKDDAVSARAGEAIASAVIDAKPDLIAVEPAIQAGSAAVVGSQALDRVFTSAVRSFHEAVTQRDADSAVLALADFGATLATALTKLMPDVAANLPPDLNVTLAQFGGQEGAAATLIPILEAIRTLAWVLPLIALVIIAAAFWISPSRRRAFLSLGWTLVGVGVALGVVWLLMLLGSAVVDGSTTSGALISAALLEFAQPLGVLFLVITLIGALLVVSASALLPQFDLTSAFRVVAAYARRRPSSPAWALVRALGIVAVGLIVIALPTLTAQVVAVIGGLLILFVGVTELDQLAERYRKADTEADAAAEAAEGPQRPTEGQWGRRVVPALAGVGALVLIGLVIVPQQLPQPTAGAPSTSDTGCNGFEALCDKPFNELVIPATHNSMSVADGSWFLAEQPKDMVASLDDGVRGLLVDTWYGQATDTGGAITADRSVAAAEQALEEEYGSEVVASIRRTVDRARNAVATGPVEPFFCHTVCELGATQMLGEMKRLKAWFDEHPSNVVVLFIQDAVTPQDTAKVLDEAGLTPLTYTHPEGAEWPTLQEMIDADQHLVVLMEHTSGGTQYPFLHDGFALVQDTEYTFATAADFTCTLKRGSPDSPLFMVNHWLASFTALVSNAQEVNAYDVLKARIDDCQEVRERTPNLIAVNWYDQGDLFRVVKELNGVG